MNDGSATIPFSMIGAIGPFKFNHESNEVTLEPGAYTVSKPVVFGITKNTRIDGVHYRSEGIKIRCESPSVLVGNVIE